MHCGIPITSVGLLVSGAGLRGVPHGVPLLVAINETNRMSLIEATFSLSGLL